MKSKVFFLGFLLSVWLCSACKREELPHSSCLKGRLAVKGICMNYVIEVIEGQVDSSQVEKLWKNPMTGKTYTQAFALRSICSFPENMKEGDEFHFNIAALPEDKMCAQCKAYSPVPSRGLSIKLCD
ncbi:hypothetical protein EWU23_04560 [Cytophagaceae bacterium 50C-KIRBA]|uniref:Lipoprotein n=1 Tax=Aquirufa beregesia TaxID=2516556 RepID=A0ABX0EWI1_9BACT|nr:hypothetical protein [Aquirufa beregesia]NGZ43743.1 hypothetical protein [Aquirufa beregesia]